MVLAVPEERWAELDALCRTENVEATVIGQFVPTGRLQLFYDGKQVADLEMRFLHDGRPPVVRRAVWKSGVPKASIGEDIERPTWSGSFSPTQDGSAIYKSFTDDLLRILGSPNVASKEWIVRQYDHEVQGGSVVKAFVGAESDGPSDAAVIRPVLSSRRGVVIACGMNPRYGDFDTYHMAASAIDEAVRNCVAVGADPRQIAILDNFCWGDCERPETLGGLVRAALACHDVSIALGTPFISGKDSLNNEFSYSDASGTRQTIAIPPSLLISALGQIDDVSKCVTMDFKSPGNLIYIVGETRDEMAGSHFALVNNIDGGQVPTVDATRARSTFSAIHNAISSRLVRACHDLSEGGLAVAAAEMAFAGNLGARIDLAAMPTEDSSAGFVVRLFSESNTRFLCEVEPTNAAAFEQTLKGIPHANIGNVTSDGRLVTAHGADHLIDVDVDQLKQVWKAGVQS
jgi:phosphoribosylformylglycinamidine synthase